MKLPGKLQKVRVRIAPSPTGALHIGTARAAFFNFLFAKKHKGIFVLRIEDTDKERSEERWEKDIIHGLKWLGINWQEGLFRQSERGEIYKKYIKKLIDEKSVYHCFCTKEELDAQRQHSMSIGKPPGYQGSCKKLSEKETEEYLKQNKPFALRLKTPNEKVVFEDMIRGKIETHSENFGDMVLVKGTDRPLYNLAVVIDDFEMKISHVIRGEDHISNTPKQILIARALGIESPIFAHLPLVLGKDRSKMSKRHGATSITEYQDQGYLPDALLNFLALLGWNPGDEREIFSVDQLIKEFSLSKVQKSGAIFNIDKLDWLNGSYIRKMPIDELTKLCIPYLIKSKLINEPVGESTPALAEYEAPGLGQELSFKKISEIISLYHERLKKLSEIPDLVDFFFKQEISYDRGLLKWKDMSDKELKHSLDTSLKVLSDIDNQNWSPENIQEILMSAAEKLSKNEKGSRGALLWPLRVALSGKKASASPFDLAAALGKDRAIQKIKVAIDKLV